MFTACPKCRTVYAIEAAQLRSGRGDAICGHCKITFSTFKHLTDSLEDALSSTSNPSLQLPTLTAENAVAAGIPPPAGQPISQSKENRGFPPETGFYPLPETPLAPPPVYWKIGVAALTGLLLFQLIYFEGERWAQNAYLRPIMESLCKGLGCDLPPYRKVTEIQVVDHSFFPARNPGEGYELHLAMINHAPNSQPYPPLRISFTTLDGTLIGRRVLKPREYLQDSSPPLMPSQRMLFVQIEFAAPRRALGGYQVELLN